MTYIEAVSGERALVSPQDVARLSEHKWQTSSHRSAEGGCYFLTSIGGKTTYMHRLVLNAPADLEIDHINNDASDNRRENLRLATRQQNCANRKGYNPKSGFRGVYPQTNGATWRARISCNGKMITGGNYRTAEEAARKYDQMASDLFGEFAILNFPQEKKIG